MLTVVGATNAPSTMSTSDKMITSRRGCQSKDLKKTTQYEGTGGDAWPPPVQPLCGVVDPLVERSDAMQSILDRELLLFELLDRHGVGVRSRHQCLNLLIQMPMVTR